MESFNSAIQLCVLSEDKHNLRKNVILMVVQWFHDVKHLMVLLNMIQEMEGFILNHVRVARMYMCANDTYATYAIPTTNIQYKQI
jgi:hypothetical protein